MRIQVPPGAHAIVQGRVREGVVAFTDPFDGGTYVYLGHAEPIETSDIVAVVDPGMPAWLKEAFDRNLPSSFTNTGVDSVPGCRSSPWCM